MQSLRVMLAASEIPQVSDLCFPLLASYKIDGVRCPIIDGVAYSRKMIPIPNRYFQKWVADYRDQLHGVDGEVVVGLPCGEGVFQRSGAILSQGGQPDFTLYVFDLWNAEGCKALERHDMLREKVVGIPNVKVIEQCWVNNAEALNAMMQKALDAGFEGLILKDPKGMYKHGRSTVREGLLLKWKEWADSEAVVLDVLQGTTNTNPDVRDATGHAKRSTAKAGKVPIAIAGSFLVRDLYSGVEFRCGTGSCSLEEVKQMWLDRDCLKGRTMVYKFQKVGVKDKPRFPGFKGWRDPIDTPTVAE